MISWMGLLAALAVILLGGLGAVLRLFLSRWNGWLPWGILTANTLGSLVAGAAIWFGPHNTVTILATVGLAGGLSTFSSWAAQTSTFLANNQRARAIANTLLNLALPALAVVTGLLVTATLLK